MTATRANVCTSSKHLEREMWFADKIARASGEPFCGMFAGATDRATRAQRARELIVNHKLTTQRVVPNRPDTFADCFQRLYGEPLSESSPSDPSPQQLEVFV